MTNSKKAPIELELRPQDKRGGLPPSEGNSASGVPSRLKKSVKKCIPISNLYFAPHICRFTGIIDALFRGEYSFARPKLAEDESFYILVPTFIAVKV